MSSSVKCPISKGIGVIRQLPRTPECTCTHARTRVVTAAALLTWQAGKTAWGWGGALEVSLAQPRSALILH